ncbi:MAG: FkbM family methyltransferase [Clostridiales bacterium]|nr:FkbM family methyltransferase [Clostridiales bacterium]
MSDAFDCKQDIWKYLTTAQKPVVLYGTGNGADKILDHLLSLGISVSGVFASSGFVRNRHFRGFKVESYEDLHKRLGDMIVLLCFGTSLPDVIANIDRIAEECEVYAPDVPVYGETVFDSAFAEENREKLQAVRDMLSDETSRDTFNRVVSYKLTGNYVLLRPCERPLEEITSLFSLPEQSSYIDLGAYDGDTVSLYTGLFPQITSVLAVEPDARNFRKLSGNLEALDRDSLQIECVRALVSDHDGTAFVPKNRGRGVHELSDTKVNHDNEVQGESLTVASLVTLLRGRKADLIKLDVEGNERAVIEGGRSCIEKDKPSLIVSCYHRSEDLFTLPLLLKEIVPEYKVYMRHHPHLLCWDTEFLFTL